jgi:DNA-binding beta-propeller fold protein YncE
MSFGIPELLQHPIFNRCVRPFLTLGIIACAGVMLSCATPDSTKLDSTPGTSELVWPLPPEQPRIKYVGALHSEDQIVPPESTMTSLRNSLLGKTGKGGRQLKKPYAVHADNEGRVFVADSGWGKVLVFDEQNKSFSVWGTNGKGILAKPLGVSSDNQGNIYVTDSLKKRVVVFNPDGMFLRAMGKKGELERPIGIVIDDERDRVYVVDSKAHHIVSYNKNGELVETLGKRGAEPGEFNWPTNIALDSSGNLYVVDSMNFRIQVLNPDGTHYKSFGSNGDGRGQFVRAKGIAVNSLGHIYVTDAAFNNIQIFNDEGALLLDVGSMGREPGQFILPAGLFIDRNDQIYVSDQYNFRVQIFKYLKHKEEFDKQQNTSNIEQVKQNKVTSKPILQQDDRNHQEEVS